MTTSDKSPGDQGASLLVLQTPPSADKKIGANKSVPRTRKEKCQTAAPGCPRGRPRGRVQSMFIPVSGRLSPFFATTTTGRTTICLTSLTHPRQKRQTVENDNSTPHGGWRPGLCRGPPRQHQTIKQSNNLSHGEDI